MTTIEERPAGRHADPTSNGAPAGWVPAEIHVQVGRVMERCANGLPMPWEWPELSLEVLCLPRVWNPMRRAEQLEDLVVELRRQHRPVRSARVPGVVLCDCCQRAHPCATRRLIDDLAGPETPR